MLELKNIVKDYPAGDGTVHALKGISLNFRNADFVSILGPSGCGKTTMLNIIGGLDKYTQGDLVIGGTSTTAFKDRDWDGYRNHSIGFVFQSYNLIPHQTVLQNVELALTLSGVSKAERRERAKKALEAVGLATQLKKLPGEMSGGQMQRVAIARALVNDPDIILADEPTGALDTETSLQVMEILKEISKDRLIIMVTHNPDIAEKYSTRIIKMLDGEITGDSNPLTDEEIEKLRKEDAEKKEKQSKKKLPSMSFATSFGLSLKNLFTKKGRTILTSFAGSIGIIGIALIFSVSHGMTTYIDYVQEDTLSSYPLTLQAQNVDFGSLLETYINLVKGNKDHDHDAVYQKPAMYDLVNTMSTLQDKTNDLRSFKKYLEEERSNPNSTSGLRDALSAVQYTYNLSPLIYTKSVDGTIIHSDVQELMSRIFMKSMSKMLGNMLGGDDEGSSSSSSLLSPSMFTSSNATYGMGSNTYMNIWQEMVPGKDGEIRTELLDKQYDLIYGAWPTAYNEVVLVLDENNEIGDMALYALGLVSEKEIDDIMDAAINNTTVEKKQVKWSYEEICKTEFRMILNANCYRKDETTGLYTDLRDTDAGLKYLYDNAIPLKVVGIIRPAEDAVSNMLTGAIAYTHLLTEYVIEENTKSEAIAAQKADPSVDIFTGLAFKDSNGKLTDAEKAETFKKNVSLLSKKELAKLYMKIKSVPPEDFMKESLEKALGAMTREDINRMITQGIVSQTGMSQADVNEYVSAMSDEEIYAMLSQTLQEQVKSAYAAQVEAQMGALDEEQLSAVLLQEMETYTDEQLAEYYELLEFSRSNYDANLIVLGCVDLDDPFGINLYASSFANKDIIKDAIDAYNEAADEGSQIEYTDIIGLLMSSITTIINAITYVLIAFVAISLVVSSIMIGVITLISVQERTKEIGILRAIGASKRNVSHMFNAETMIIGFTAGLLGVVVTYLMCIPINIILHNLTGLHNLSAILPIPVALVLITISVLLTLISGIIPSRSAAKKDPVVALRTE